MPIIIKTNVAIVLMGDCFYYYYYIMQIISLESQMHTNFIAFNFMKTAVLVDYPTAVYGQLNRHSSFSFFFDEVNWMSLSQAIIKSNKCNI